MKFIMMIHGKNHDGRPPEPKLMAAINKLAEEETKAGHMIFTGGLGGPDVNGVRLNASGGQLSTVDGPFTETKELIAGFALMEFPTKDEALASARRFMKVHQEINGPTWEGTMEIHQVFTM